RLRPERGRPVPAAHGSRAIGFHYRYAIDLDVEGPRPAWNAQKDPRRTFYREVPRIHFVDLAEVGHIRAVDVAFEHMRHGRAGALQASLHLIEHDLGLAFDGL